jgi:hypothetical protein
MQPNNRVAFATGNTLLDACRSEERDSICSGYIAGIADAINNSMYSILRPDKSGTNMALVCTTKRILLPQLVDVVVRFLESHPEMRHYAAASLVGAALSDAFPCAG